MRKMPRPMAKPTQTLLGDIDVETLLQDHPNHGIDNWVIECFLRGTTLRMKQQQAQAIRVILCNAWHALDPRGVQSEQSCANRTNSATCLHGEQWTSGLGVIRQFVQPCNGIRLATPEEVRVITQAQDELGNCDFMAHRNAPDIRETADETQRLLKLRMIERAVSDRQTPIGERILRTRDTVSARVMPYLDMPYDHWLGSRA